MLSEMKSKWPLWYSKEITIHENLEKAYATTRIHSENDINLQQSKQLSIDFVCQKTLGLSTLKEFVEIFLSSIAKDSAFHFEILSGFYKYLGITLDFNENHDSENHFTVENKKLEF